MKKLLFLVVLFSLVTSSFMNAQCTKADNTFVHNPDNQASIVAEADDTIQEMTDELTGEVYFIRKIENPWNGQLSFTTVTFDATTATFVDANLYAINGDDDQLIVTKKPCPTQKDTCVHKQPNRLPSQGKTRPQPRRSSRVKLANNF